MKPEVEALAGRRGGGPAFGTQTRIDRVPRGAFSCMVQNLSDSGAALDVPSSIGIPEDFTLVILERGAASVGGSTAASRA